MTKTYKTYLPDQDLLLPPSLRDWLPENHLVYCVSDVVDQLDLSAIESVYEEEDRGQPPYHPRMMTKILVYGYCVGVFSSRRIQKRLEEDVAFRVLAAGNQPDFRTISDFRKLHLQALEGLFQQVLRQVLEMGALKLGRVALDGSKVKANASKHKAMSYGVHQLGSLVIPISAHCDGRRTERHDFAAVVTKMCARVPPACQRLPGVCCENDSTQPQICDHACRGNLCKCE